MKKPEPKYEKMDVPRLSQEIKEKNGKSTRRLSKCIEALTDLLDHEEHHEEAAEQPRHLRDTGTE